MKRFISCDELARDRRFTRAEGQNQLIRSLPDDVDAIVRVFEQIAPSIRRRVRGTPSEAAFEELGPGFACITSSERARVGGKVGEFPESTFLFETSCVDDPVLRVTGVNRCLEGLACDAFRSLIDFACNKGDEVMAQAVDFVLADELTHVSFGSNWVREFTAGDPERAERARAFQRETDRRFTVGGPRSIARDERLEAGFSEEELAELDAINADGPRRETLVRAAEILRDRHQARRLGEDVAPLPA